MTWDTEALPSVSSSFPDVERSPRSPPASSVRTHGPGREAKGLKEISVRVPEDAQGGPIATPWFST